MRRKDIFKQLLPTGAGSGKAMLFASLCLGGFLFAVLQGCQKDFTDLVKPPVTDTNPTKANGPNIIIIIADDMGYEIPGYTGGDSYNTQNLNYMSKTGTQFRQTYSHPDGYPSRLAMYTGKYNFRNYTFWGQLPAGDKTIGNMLHDAGYNTCFVGKWQCNGGDSGIKAAGFDKYRVFLPFAYSNQRIGRYKSPVLYEKGDFLPPAETKDKFSEDMFVDYLSNFIDSSKATGKPFFAIYSQCLITVPWVPTPDDPDYPSWDPTYDNENSNQKYFPGMVKYMDLMVGRVYNKINSAGLKNNTIIMFTSDNATNKQIRSIYKGDTIQGGKNLTTMKGTHMPFLVYWPGKIPIRQKNTTTIIDYTDFMPTIADMAGIPRPTNYGTLDGVSFYDNLLNIPGGQDRSWYFCHWDNSPLDEKQPIRYVANTKYKLYDTLGYSLFYNLQYDPDEKIPYPDDILSKEEKDLKLEFEQILQSMH